MKRVGSPLGSNLAVSLILLASPLDLGAQPPPGAGSPDPVTETAAGLRTTTFDTLVGTVTVNLPDDLAAGDVISGSVIADPKGKTDPEKSANQSELNGYVVEVDKEKVPADNQVAKFLVPLGALSIPLILRDREGREVGRVQVPVKPTSAGPVAQVAMAEGPGKGSYQTPAITQAGKPVAVKGAFDGDSLTSGVTIGGKTARILAESPRQIVLASPSGVAGSSDIEVKEQDKVVARCTYQSVGIRLSATKLDLIRGEETTVMLSVSGLTGMTSPVDLRLVNRSPGAVRLKGGDSQHFTVDPRQAKDGGYATTRSLTALRAGGFSINATVDGGRLQRCAPGTPPGGLIAGPSLSEPGDRPTNPQMEKPGDLPRGPDPQPSPPGPSLCRAYGDRGALSGGSPPATNCCTADPVITRVQSGICQGISPDLPGSSPSRGGSETSIAFVPAWTDAGGLHGARLVMGFNGSGLLNWVISTDQGRTWRDRNRSNGGPGGGAVDNPTTPFNSYRGDLSVVALPRPGGVAMVTLADKLPCTPGPGAPCPASPDLIVLLVSIDGGETFSKTSIVNDRLGIGVTDQPRVTVDAGDGTIWVLWRARPPLAPYYTYVRGGHIGANGSVTWDINGDGQLVFSNPVFTTLDYQHPRIKVFTRPGARAHTVAITGPQGAPLTTFFAQGRCVPGTSGAIRNSFWQYPLGVFFTVSDDDGQHWTDLHSAVDMGQPFGLGCVGGAGGADATGQLIYSENRIDLARDPRNGTYLVTRARAVNDSMSFFVGQQVEVWRRSTAPGARFSLVASALWSSSNPWQFNPSIAARDDGQIAVSYYQTVGSTQTVELMVMGSRDGGNTWTAPVQLSRNAPWTASDRSLGEYDEIVALPESVLSPVTPSPSPQFWPGAFYASWSNGVGRVFAAGYSPPEL